MKYGKYLSALMLATMLAGCQSVQKQGEMSLTDRIAPDGHAGASELLQKGRYHLSMRQYGLAIGYFRRAARDAATQADAQNGLAVAYAAMGRRDMAERYFELAMAAAPGNARYRANLLRFYAASGQQEKRARLLAMAPPPAPQERALTAAAEAAPRPVLSARGLLSVALPHIDMSANSPAGQLIASSPADPAPSPKRRNRAAAADQADRPRPVRLERLSMAEVQLVTLPAMGSARQAAVQPARTAAPAGRTGFARMAAGLGHSLAALARKEQEALNRPAKAAASTAAAPRMVKATQADAPTRAVTEPWLNRIHIDNYIFLLSDSAQMPDDTIRT